MASEKAQGEAGTRRGQKPQGRSVGIVPHRAPDPEHRQEPEGKKEEGLEPAQSELHVLHLEIDAIAGELQEDEEVIEPTGGIAECEIREDERQRQRALDHEQPNDPFLAGWPKQEEEGKDRADQLLNVEPASHLPGI